MGNMAPKFAWKSGFGYTKRRSICTVQLWEEHYIAGSLDVGCDVSFKCLDNGLREKRAGRGGGGSAFKRGAGRKQGKELG